jgi:type IV pilus assembly protein PilV
MQVRPPFRAAALFRQSGASLLEVLVAMLLLSFGMLALAGMQAYSVSAQKNAANRAIASALAGELAELIRLNPDGLATKKYDGINMLPNAVLPVITSALCTFPNCTTDTLADRDIATVRSRVRELLSKGGVELIRPAGSTTQADIWILWEEPAVFDNTRTAGGTTQSAELHSDNCPTDAKALNPLPRCFYLRVQL